MSEAQDVFSPVGRPYVVFVDDNFHYMDDEYRYCAGSFWTASEAVSLCRAIVDEYLASAFEPGMCAADLLSSYKMFGEDPFIVGSRLGRIFSAWDYAEIRSNQICNMK
jgi:hypothetical protein